LVSASAAAARVSRVRICKDRTAPNAERLVLAIGQAMGGDKGPFPVIVDTGKAADCGVIHGLNGGEKTPPRVLRGQVMEEVLVLFFVIGADRSQRNDLARSQGNLFFKVRRIKRGI